MRPLFIAVGVLSGLAVIGVLGMTYLSLREGEEGVDYLDVESLPSGSYAGALA